MQKEFKQMLDAIGKWIDANEGGVAFIGSFISFDVKKEKSKDDIILGYGSKEVLEISLEKLQKSLKEEKENFVNW